MAVTIFRRSSIGAGSLQEQEEVAQRCARKPDEGAAAVGGDRYVPVTYLSRLGGDWAADIRSYDQGHEHMLMFSDVLADGIIRQFPNRFA